MNAEHLQTAARLAVSLLPVLAFLAALILLDSYKLVRLRSVLQLILLGAVMAWVCLWLHRAIRVGFDLEITALARYVAPVIEELLKGVVIVYLIRRNRVGFLVDAAISSFAVGTGFAVVENLYYYVTLSDPNPLLWVLRGFGTAVMHGGVAAIMAVTSKHLAERYGSTRLGVFVPGLLAAIVIHSAYNHFFISPDHSAVALLIVLPLVFFAVFRHSEGATRSWLGIGFDTDSELLELIQSGRASESRVGRYLNQLKASFPGETLVDMLCLIRLHLELSIQAKGTLLARQAGFNLQPGPEVQERFTELRYLERSIGRTGMLALEPMFNMSSHDLWQFCMLKK